MIIKKNSLLFTALRACLNVFLDFCLFVVSVWELFQAESIADDGTCGNSSVSSDATGVSDAVRRQLQVDAEGLENEYTYSSFVCPSGEWNMRLGYFLQADIWTTKSFIYIVNYFLCACDKNWQIFYAGEPGTLTENIQLQLPFNRIQDSERGFMNIIGKYLSFTVKWLILEKMS